MRYWFISLRRPDLERCIATKCFGLNRKYVLGKVAQGDKVVCCASKEWKIIAVGEATSEHYIDLDKKFLSEGLFPDRFDFEATKLAAEVDLIQILDKLTFIKNLAYWSVYFRNGIVEIDKADWSLITATS